MELQRIFKELQKQTIIEVKWIIFCVGSTNIKYHLNVFRAKKFGAEHGKLKIA